MGLCAMCTLDFLHTLSSYVMVIEFLFPQVKVSFHTTVELLRYQHLPETQLLPGFQVLQLENGERKLKFNQTLVIEYSNYTTQVRPGQGLWALERGCFSNISDSD